MFVLLQRQLRADHVEVDFNSRDIELTQQMSVLIIEPTDIEKGQNNKNNIDYFECL